MVFKETEFQLKDGRAALLRSPREEDAEEMLRFIIKASGETDFLMKYPEEWAEFSLEQEKAFINDDYCDQNGMMISCIVGGEDRRKLSDLFSHRNERPAQGFRRDRASSGILEPRDRDKDVRRAVPHRRRARRRPSDRA